MIILGIETSCDETAAAVVTDKKEILSNKLFSQVEAHRFFGGVVPEIGARAHLEKIQEVVQETMREVGIRFEDLSAIAATCGPGLIGGVLVGAVTGKTIAAYHEKPFVAVNHLEAHALSARLTEDVSFPYLLLLVSGGHCQLIHVHEVGRYEVLGTTIDDASGEAFDKVARLLGFDYPGGPAVERAARKGDPNRFPFPRPLSGRPGYDFSFSGLKSSVLREVEKLGSLSDQDKFDIAASFQKTVTDIFLNRLKKALKADLVFDDIVIAGGVAANQYIRTQLDSLVTSSGKRFVAPPIQFCTDNGAMVAWAGLERFQRGLVDPLTFQPRPRWPLKDL